MASLFSALGNLAAQAGDAKAELNDEQKKTKAMELAQQFKNRQLSIEEQRLGFEGERVGVEKDKFAFEKTKEQRAAEDKGWDKALTFTGANNKKKQFNPVTGKFRDYEVPEGFTQDKKTSDMNPTEVIAATQAAMGKPLTDVEKAKKLGIAPSEVSPYELKQDKQGQYVYMPRNPDSGLKPQYTGVFGHLPKETGKNGLGDPDIDTLKQSKTIMALARKWKDEGIKPPAKYQAMVEAVMDDLNMKAKIKLPAADEKMVSGLVKMEPPVERLQKFLEDNKLTQQNSWLFGAHSALAQHMRFMGYKKGVAPEKISSELIKDAAALQVQGAAPWMAIGRSKYTFETIVQHLPAPTDTPQNLYEKVQWLKINILDDAKDALTDDGLSEYEKRVGKREGAGASGASTNLDNEIDKILGKGKPE